MKPKHQVRHAARAAAFGVGAFAAALLLVACGGDSGGPSVSADVPECVDGSDCPSGVCVDAECVAPTCEDGLHNGDETDEDCGGSCGPCGDQGGCVVDADCDGGVCLDGACATPSCDDGARNGAESDTDCGGMCDPCSAGRSCRTDTDCADSRCADGVCAAPGCEDGQIGGSETDVDCGGDCDPCARGASCGQPGDCLSEVCTDGVCAAPSCRDEVRNGSETEIDCGGSCPACPVGDACLVGTDCESRVCDAGICQAPSCADGVRNGLEPGVDCGAECGPCGDGVGCAGQGDCTSGVCRAGVCASPSCRDGVRNGIEMGVDCGGPCAACPAGEPCEGAGDCLSGVCADGVCRSPTCEDGVRNALEADVDCGEGCLPCPIDSTCRFASDCADGSCREGRCLAPGCDDGLHNGDETDLDCGGSCPACGHGAICETAGDCLGEVCDAQRCVIPTCSDGVHNGLETDLDCGSGCPACPSDARCLSPEDCLSGVCSDGVCAAPACGDEVRNGDETDLDCGGDCPACEVGAACVAPEDCADGVCGDGVCRPPTCHDAVRNGFETGIDCGGDECAPCADGGACAVGDDCRSGVCDGQECAPATCADFVRNGTETDVDCGGECGACPEEGACVGDADCATGLCDPFTLRCVWRRDCADLAQRGEGPSGVFTLDPDGQGPIEPYQTWCDMDHDGGGWTLAMKIDGARNTFRYDAGLWTNEALFNTARPGWDTREAKLASYNHVAFDEVLLVMRYGDDERRGQFFYAGESLFDVIGDGEYKRLWEGSGFWKGLAPGGSIQTLCQREGFNVRTDGARARIGMWGDNRTDCRSPDSRIGVGTQGSNCGQNNNNSAGNEARCDADEGNNSRSAFAYVLVRRRWAPHRSCLEIRDAGEAEGSGVYILDPDGEGGAPPQRAWCDMETDGGGWTLLIKQGGNNSLSYGSSFWTDENWLRRHEVGLQRVAAKFEAFATVPFTQLRLGMARDEVTRWATLDYTADSLLAVLGPGEEILLENPPGRQYWLDLVGDGASLQRHCDHQGFNLAKGTTNARIGIVSDNQENCSSFESRIGFGLSGTGCRQPGSISCGNAARCEPENGSADIRTFGYILAR